MCESSLGRGGAGRQGHYVYIVQTIYLIFIKIKKKKRSLFIPVYVKQSQGARFPSCRPGSRGEGAHGQSKAEVPRDAPVPSRVASALPCSSAVWRGVRGPPHMSLASSPGPIYFWINSWYSADVSGQDLEV